MVLHFCKALCETAKSCGAQLQASWSLELVVLEEMKDIVSRKTDLLSASGFQSGFPLTLKLAKEGCEQSLKATFSTEAKQFPHDAKTAGTLGTDQPSTSCSFQHGTFVNANLT